MNNELEQMIARDSKMSIAQIRRLPWSELDKNCNKKLEKPFRPWYMNLIGGNIFLADGKYLRGFMREIRSINRKVMHDIKCLRKNSRKE